MLKKKIKKNTIMQMIFGHLYLIKAHRGNYIQP